MPFHYDLVVNDQPFRASRTPRVINYGPSLGPGGEWLYFNSHRDGQSDIFRVRLAELLS